VNREKEDQEKNKKKKKKRETSARIRKISILNSSAVSTDVRHKKIQSTNEPASCWRHTPKVAMQRTQSGNEVDLPKSKKKEKKNSEQKKN